MSVMGWDENRFGDDRRTPQGFAVRLGVVEVAGPQAQPDYGDERYWVREHAIQGAPSPWDPVVLRAVADWTVKDPRLPENGGGGDVTIRPVYTVTNVVEAVDHTHTPKSGTPVLFFGFHDAGTTSGAAPNPQPLARYLMAVGGALPTGQYQEMVYKMVSQNQAGWDMTRAHGLVPNPF
jgi:hypothetical protein